jgi:hypothetical protein
LVPYIVGGAREIGRTCFFIYVGLGGLSGTGCERNLPRYKGLAGLARRYENARRGTAERRREGVQAGRERGN